MSLAMNLATRTFSTDPPVTAYFRPGSSDEDAINEVIDRHTYRRVKDGFDVEPGERWLDLGANVGAFALYCRLRGAAAVCYEPEPVCFSILEQNAPRFEKFNLAVTDKKDKHLTFYDSFNPDNHYRTTTFAVQRYKKLGEFANTFGGNLTGYSFDGVKMDIEGSEFGLIDKWLLPKTKKLVMEYHISRDRSWQNLAKRIKILKGKFTHVWHPKVLQDYIDSEGDVEIRFDQIIFCWGAK